MSVTFAQGFKAAGVAAGLKKSGNKDIAIVHNLGPAYVAAAQFTSNRVKAAPVKWSEQVLVDGRVDAVLLNSGGANACTGADGFLDTHRSAEFVAEALGISAADLVVCSTGLIGERLPMDLLLAGAAEAIKELSLDGGPEAALAIMTTDTKPKTATAEFGKIRIGGMAKGAGMLAPSLATMLVVITTDALLDTTQLDMALQDACNTSFNRLDSDGCQSTNDTVLLMSSGASGVAPNLADFTAALSEVTMSLALQLQSDAEGVSKEVFITTIHASSIADAEEVGRACARNNLLKCALHGEDPNWGRVLAAVGTTSALFDPDRIDVSMNGVTICRNGGIGDDRNLVDLSGRKIEIVIDLRAGSESATIMTNDLTAEYVHENSAYSS